MNRVFQFFLKYKLHCVVFSRIKYARASDYIKLDLGTSNMPFQLVTAIGFFLLWGTSYDIYLIISVCYFINNAELHFTTC